MLSIRVTKKHSDFYNASLFQGLDFTADSGKVYLNGLPGPGGPAYIFSYYAPMAADAEEMLQGLGCYAGRIYGNRTMNACFTASHWNGNKGWQWNKSDGCFLTPATRQREANLKFDPNLAIEKLAKMESMTIITKEPNQPSVATKKPKPSKKKRSRTRKGKKTTPQDKDDDSATFIDPLKTKEIALLHKAMNHDDDSQVQPHSAGHVKDKDVTQITIPAEDDVSIASTLTMGSIIDHQTQSTRNNNIDIPSPNSSIQSNGSSLSSLKSVSNPTYFASLVNKGMTEQEIRERASTFYQHQVNKAQLDHERALESYLSSHLSSTNPVVTPHKPKQTDSLDVGKES